MSWDEIRRQVIEPGVPARLALSTSPRIWLSLKGNILALSTPLASSDALPPSPVRQIRLATARHKEGQVLEISTDRPDLYREFFFLSLGIVDMMKSRGREALIAFMDALETWKELLKAASTMTAERQLGLLGELWMLSRLLGRRGTQALAAWTGPRAEPHDFRLQRNEFEVKSTRSVSRVHIINGLAQLVPSKGCRLHVLSLQWELAGTADGWTLPAMVADIRSGLRSSSSSLAAFNQLITEACGYRDEDAPLYTDRLRLRTSPAVVPVADDLPRITRVLLEGSFAHDATRIDDVTYRLDLDGLGFEENSREFRKLLP